MSEKEQKEMGRERNPSRLLLSVWSLMWGLASGFKVYPFIFERVHECRGRAQREREEQWI